MLNDTDLKLMFVKSIKYILAISCFLVAIPSFAEDQLKINNPNIGGKLTDCDNSKAVIDVESRLAKASLISNFFSGKGSLSTELKELAQKGKEGIGEISPPQCISSCKGELTKKVQFMVFPNKLKSQYSEAKVCGKLYEQTKTSPINLSKKGLRSVDNFSKWFSNSAQGKGEDGAQLYKECPGSCSPRYEVLLDFEDEDVFNANIAVECGHARDKSDNQYQVKLAYVWECESSP